MALNFNGYGRDPGEETRNRWSQSLDGIFEQYQKSKQAGLAERDRVGNALLNTGVDPRQVTPESMEHPDDVHGLRAFIDRKKAAAAQVASGAQLDADKTRSGIKVDEATVNEKNANAERARRVNPEGSGPRTVNIKGVDYIETQGANGVPHYQPIPERQPTQSEYAAKGYADKASQAALEAEGYNPSQTGNIVQSVLPTAMQNGKFQTLDQSKRQFVNAILRRESGAAISASENDNYTRQYFPVPGDKPEVIRHKAESRKLAIAGLSSEGHRVASNLPAGGGKKGPDPLGLFK